jgi:crotonobetainyl-CoA:carnitine CoA-transferase CaiB-like acyl-CoA transferase
VTLLVDVWELLAGSRELPTAFVVDGSRDILPAALPVGELAIEAVGASLLAASALAAHRNGGAPATASVDTAHVAAAFQSERHARVNGEPAGASFAPLSRFWRASDGWIRTHANYPWHEQRLLSVLGVGPEPDTVAKAIAEWHAEELEAAVFSAGGCAAVVRDPEQWVAHPQGASASRLPLIELGRVGDGPPWTGAQSTKALDGVRVLDLTRVIAGPVCTRTLAAHGADVVRVDSPQLPELDGAWIDANPGKRSVLVDFATDEGRAILDRLLEDVDVVVVGYRPGALARFGLTADELAGRHPGVVLVTLCAWGDRGPWAERRGFDSLVQSASGIARREAVGRDEPGALPVQALDHATGYLAAAAAMAGLLRQSRDGGTWHTRLSLAQTAAWLLRAPEPLPGAAASPSDSTPFVVELARGTDVVSLVAPPGMLGGEHLAWPSAPSVPGGDAPEWRLS